MVRSYSKFLLFLFIVAFNNSFSATFYSRANGSWNTPSTWSLVSCNGAPSAFLPNVSDNVIICAGRTVSMNGNPAFCNSLTINGTAHWNSALVINVGAGGLILNPGSSITGSGGPNNGTINVAGNFTVNSGGTSTLQRGSLTVAGTTNILGTFSITSAFGNKNFQDVNITGGTFNSNATETYTINGNVLLTNGRLSGTSTGIWNVAGTFTVAPGTSVLGAGTLTVTGLTTINGTLNENSATGTKSFSSIVMNSGSVWNNLSAETYSVSGTLTMNGATITGTAAGRYDITGGFIVSSGTNVMGQTIMNVTGPTTVNSILNITSTGGTKTFSDITISASGSWNCTVAEDFVINGNFANNGVFTANTGIYQLAGMNKIISGASLSSFTNLNNTGRYTNNGLVEVNGSHYGAGAFSQGTTGSYFQKMPSASFTVTIFNASAVGNSVTYNLAGAQNIRVPSDGSYYHLTSAGSGIKSLIGITAAGGNLLISSGTTINSNNFNLFVQGNFTNNGAFTAGIATVTLNGTALQTIGGTVITTFANLTISNSTGIALALNTNVSGILNFTAGVITTATSKVIITSTGSVTGAGTSRFVNGFLQKNVASGSGVVRTYEIGNGTTNYLPVTLDFASVSVAGNVTASVSNSDHANIAASCIDGTKSVNHVWTLTNSGIVFTSYSASCTFIGAPADADAGSVAANYYMSVYSGGVWTLLTQGTVAANVNQGTGIPGLGDLQIGERVVPTIPVQPSNDTACNNTSASFSLAVNGIGLSYQWQENAGSGFVNVVNGGIYSGAATNTLTVNPVNDLMNGYQYQCVISNTCGTALVYSNIVALTVIPNVTASVTIVPSSDTICAGTNVIFNATPVNGGTLPTYQWQLNGANTGSNSSSYSSAALANGDQVSVLLTSNAQCVIGSPAVSNMVSMTVNPNLPVSVSISATSTSICPGTPVTFTATPVNGGTSPVYQWQLNGANVGTNSTVYTDSAFVNGDQIVCTITSNAVCPTGNPAASNTITMTVNPFLPVSVSISANPSGTVCAGTLVTFTATPVNGGAAPAYQWQLNGINIGSNSANYSNNALVTSDEIRCILTSNATCATGSPDTSNAIVMTVDPLMPLSISITANPSNVICAGDNVTFIATPVNGGGYESYQWQVNGVNAGSNSAVYSSASLANGDNVVCLLSSTIACATGAPAASNTISMTVNAIAPVSVSVTANPSGPVCAGTNVTFTAAPVNGGTLPAYQWQLNGVNAGANSTIYSNSGLLNGDVVTCILTSNSSCATGNPASSTPVNMVVNPYLPVSVSITASPSGPVCSGTSVTFSATPVNGGTSPAYQWQLNGANVGTGSSTYSNAALNNGDVVSCVLTSNYACPTGNPASSNSIAMSILISGGWVGSISSDWSAAGNWCGGVPVSTTNVIIPSGTLFTPSLSNVSNCRSLSISAGANLNLNNNTLNIYGALSGAGTITGSASSAINIMAGVGSAGTLNMDQTVAGTSNTLSAISVNRSGSSIALGNTLNVTGSVDVAAGTLSTGGNLTIISNAAGTGRIGTLVSGADISGNVTMQRYIPGGTDGWMFISSPVSGVTLQSWNDDFITGGFPGSFYPPSPNPSIVSYNEGLSGIYDDGYVSPSSITDPIVAKKGYWAYIINTPVTIDVTGPIIKNDQTFSVSYTDDPAQPGTEDGWNLLANPYPSTIDWDAAGWTKTNINDAIYMYSPTLEQYTSYVGGIGTNGGSNYIASSQAFLVQASGSGPVLKLNENVKDASDGLFIRASQRSSTDDLIKLNLAGNGYSDETVIGFSATASDNFDNSYDALKFFSFNTDVPGIGSVVGNQLLSVNTFPLLNSDKIIPVKVKVGVSGNYTVSLDAASRYPESSCIMLEDLKTGSVTDLRTTPSVTVFISDTTAYPRFRLKIGQPVQSSVTAATCNGNNDGMAVVNGNGTGPWDYIWKDGNGNVIQSHTFTSATADTLQDLSSGIYTVLVSGNSGVCSSSLLAFDITLTDSISISANVNSSSCSGTADGSILISSISGGVTPYSFAWSNGAVSSDNPGLSAGAYTLSITDSTGCIQQVEYLITQSSALSALFISSNDTVYLTEDNEEYIEFTADSKFITSYQWDFGDGSPLSTAPNPSHLFGSGTYTVTLIASDGNCSDTTTQIVVVYSNITTGTGSVTSGEEVAFISNNSVTDIRFRMNRVSDVIIEVYNSMGQAVQETKRVRIMHNTISCDFSSLPKGIYYIKVSTGDKAPVIKKVVRS